jgi:hypothetical protein
VVAGFDGGSTTSDGGVLLLGQVEAKTHVLQQFAACFKDYRDPELIEHTVAELLAQRVSGLALGYEDLNDHDTLRLDPLLATVVGKHDPTGADRLRATDRGKPLAGKSTLNRLELTLPDATAAERYQKSVTQPDAIDRLFVDGFLQAHAQAPRVIVLDLNGTDDPLHGQQEGRFFHGYSKEFCYLPLYIFGGGHLLCARLRTADNDAAWGSEVQLEQPVGGNAGVRAGRRPRTLPRDGDAGPGFRGPGVSDVGQLEPNAAGGGQGRVPGEGTQSTVRGNVVDHRATRGAGVVRGRLLRSGRDGKSDQGAAGAFAVPDNTVAVVQDRRVGVECLS